MNTKYINFFILLSVIIFIFSGCITNKDKLIVKIAVKDSELKMISGTIVFLKNTQKNITFYIATSTQALNLLLNECNNDLKNLEIKYENTIMINPQLLKTITLYDTISENPIETVSILTVFSTNNAFKNIYKKIEHEIIQNIKKARIAEDEIERYNVVTHGKGKLNIHLTGHTLKKKYLKVYSDNIEIEQKKMINSSLDIDEHYKISFNYNGGGIFYNKETLLGVIYNCYNPPSPLVSGILYNHILYEIGLPNSLFPTPLPTEEDCNIWMDPYFIDTAIGEEFVTDLFLYTNSRELNEFSLLIDYKSYFLLELVLSSGNQEIIAGKDCSIDFIKKQNDTTIKINGTCNPHTDFSKKIHLFQIRWKAKEKGIIHFTIQSPRIIDTTGSRYKKVEEKINNKEIGIAYIYLEDKIASTPIPTSSPTPTSQRNPGEVWIVPQSQKVKQYNFFTTQLNLSTGNNSPSSFKILVEQENKNIILDTSPPTLGIREGKYIFIKSVDFFDVDNTDNDNYLQIEGDIKIDTKNSNDTDDKSHISIFTLTWYAEKKGNTWIKMKISITDRNNNKIIDKDIHSSITIQDPNPAQALYEYPAPSKNPVRINNEKSIWFIPRQSKVYNNDFFETKIFINTQKNILCLYDFELSYDKSIIDIADIKDFNGGIRSGFDSFFTLAEPTKRGYRIVGENPDGIVNDYFHLVTVYWQALQPGVSDITITVNRILDNNNDIISQFEAIPGQVKIMAVTPTPTESPHPTKSPSPAPSPGELWIDPEVVTIEKGQSFITDIYIHLEDQPIYGYEIELTYDKTKITQNPTKFIDKTREEGKYSIYPGRDGFKNNKVKICNDVENTHMGKMIITGKKEKGLELYFNIHLLKIYWIAKEIGWSTAKLEAIAKIETNGSKEEKEAIKSNCSIRIISVPTSIPTIIPIPLITPGPILTIMPSPKLTPTSPPETTITPFPEATLTTSSPRPTKTPTPSLSPTTLIEYTPQEMNFFIIEPSNACTILEGESLRIYGLVEVNVKDPNNINAIIQILTDDNAVQESIKKVINFNYFNSNYFKGLWWINWNMKNRDDKKLNPGKYKIRVLYDSNKEYISNTLSISIVSKENKTATSEYYKKKDAGIEEIIKNNFSLSITFFTQARKIYDLDPMVTLLLAKCHFNSCNYNSAINYLTTLIINKDYYFENDDTDKNLLIQKHLLLYHIYNDTGNILKAYDHLMFLFIKLLILKDEFEFDETLIKVIGFIMERYLKDNKLSEIRNILDFLSSGICNPSILESHINDINVISFYLHYAHLYYLERKESNFFDYLNKINYNSNNTNIFYNVLDEEIEDIEKKISIYYKEISNFTVNDINIALLLGDYFLLWGKYFKLAYDKQKAKECFIKAYKTYKLSKTKCRQYLEKLQNCKELINEIDY